MGQLKSTFSAIGFIIACLLVSCSSDGDPNSSGGTLLKKIVQTYDDGEAYIATYHYNGNKLNYISMDEGKIVYSYSGDRISAVSWQNAAGLENIHTGLDYDSSGRLSHLSNFYGGPDFENYTDYTYNDDGTVSEVDHLWDESEGCYSVENLKLFFSGNDLIKIERYLPEGTAVIEYGYDDKINPFHDIAGYDKLLTFDASPHNAISELHSGADGSVFIQANSTFEYDQAGRPTSSQRTQNGSTMTTGYFY